MCVVPTHVHSRLALTACHLTRGCYGATGSPCSYDNNRKPDDVGGAGPLTTVLTPVYKDLAAHSITIVEGKLNQGESFKDCSTWADSQVTCAPVWLTRALAGAVW